MTRDRFIVQLEEAAARIEAMPRHELAVLLRRAAIRLRNLPPVDEDLAAEYLRLYEEEYGPLGLPKDGA